MLNNPAMHTFLAPHMPKIAALCERHGVAHLEVFGSATGPDFNPKSSDFDFWWNLTTKRPDLVPSVGSAWQMTWSRFWGVTWIWLTRDTSATRISWRLSIAAAS